MFFEQDLYKINFALENVLESHGYDIRQEAVHRVLLGNKGVVNHSFSNYLENGIAFNVTVLDDEHSLMYSMAFVNESKGLPEDGELQIRVYNEDCDWEEFRSFPLGDIDIPEITNELNLILTQAKKRFG